MCHPFLNFNFDSVPRSEYFPIFAKMIQAALVCIQNRNTAFIFLFRKIPSFEKIILFCFMYRKESNASRGKTAF
ncbi:Uncharacterized protein dnm_055540 [Desulfonema magnum]|uniref:Uncharacterized protein n=1 Tax=Desulfonema magnum TaxID=45655 RepID=A0A975BPZ7_9BACT|nr:Uncharacterized protein dnm_055540 [Desulfonema magnum]